MISRLKHYCHFVPEKNMKIMKMWHLSVQTNMFLTSGEKYL